MFSHQTNHTTIEFLCIQFVIRQAQHLLANIKFTKKIASAIATANRDRVAAGT